jgi:hypothetical protein
MKLLKKHGLAMAGSMIAAVAVAGNAQAANTVTTVKVTNSTNAPAVYGPVSFAGTASPTPTNIAAGGSLTFLVTSLSDIVSGIHFTYTSGTKECRFDASHTVNVITHVPTWTKSGTSIGTTSATCGATITAASPTDPYNYTVEFTIS